MPDSPATLYLIDSHALIYQMFHAIPAMTSPDGRPVNAVFGVTRDLINISEDIRPTYLLSTFDTPEPTFRNELDPQYKAHREPPPPDLCMQIPIVHAVLEAMNLPILAIPGWEADDIMATVATAAAARGIEVTLCTSDKDCRQLIGDRVKMLNMRKKTVLDRRALMADWGVTPEQVVDFQTLVGDSVDNVKGVPGVGAKTAAKLLQQYGTVDNLMAHVDEIKQPKLKENLKKTYRLGRSGEVPQASAARNSVADDPRLGKLAPSSVGWPEAFGHVRGTRFPWLCGQSARLAQSERTSEERRVAGGNWCGKRRAPSTESRRLVCRYSGRCDTG